jgi:hypothetical protein
MRPLRFLLAAIGTFALLAALYLAAFVVALREPVWPYHWLRNVYLVKDRLAAESRAPRGLILGGSSAWFGFESGQIERATGWRVVNLGAHAELPLRFQLWQAERYLQRGDTVVLAEELGQYWPRPHRYTTYAASEVVLMAPEYWRQAALAEQADLLATIPPARVVTGLVAWGARGTAAYADRLALPSTDQLMANVRAKWAGTFAGRLPQHYNYLEVDLHGDMVRSRLAADHPHEDYGLIAAHAAEPEVWHELAAFARRMEARGVRCLSTWPPFERHPGFDPAWPEARENFEFLRAHLNAAGWRVVGEPDDGVLASEFFYDTPYHLTTEGARLRTERFVIRLKAAGLTAR